MPKYRNGVLNDVKTMMAAGFDPMTGLPINFAKQGMTKPQLKNNIKIALRILDEQNAVNRYEWYNLPDGLDGELLERILYYNGQGMFFYVPELNKFYFLPYALEGTIDLYGRFINTKALPWNGGTSDDGKAREFPNSTRKVVYSLYDLFSDTDSKEYTPDNCCVLLHDYCKQRSETNISRQIINDPILDAMSEAFPLARTSLISNSGIKGMRVQDENQQSNVVSAAMSVTDAALSGNPWIPVVGFNEFQDLTSAGSALKSEEYLLYLQALDNFRLSLYGLKNGGLFQKKAHMLESEQDMNDGNIGLVYKDGLKLRQQFCDIVNGIWGLGIWCDVPEEIAGIDRNGDGVVGSQQDQTGEPGDQPEVGGDTNE